MKGLFGDEWEEMFLIAPLDRIGLGVGNSGGDEPRTPCPWSPPPLYSTARQGPTSLAWAGRPWSGRGSRAQWAIGPIGGEINLTFSPLISSYTFNFILWNNSFQSTRSITNLHVEHVSSSRSIEWIEMDLEGGWIGTITNFNCYLAILGTNAEYESEPNNCNYSTKC